MTEAPKVSVIIPCYNCADYIEVAINSVLKQSEQDFEILVGDDCSTDTSAQIVTEISKSDSRVKLFVNAINSGPSATRNRLIEEAKGEWIALLDADDFYKPERLERLISIAEAECADLIADNITNVDKDGNKLFDAIKLDNTNELIHITAELMVKSDQPGSSGFKYGFLKPLIKKEFLNEKKVRYQENIYIGEDFFLYLECLIKSARFFLTLAPLYCYRIRSDSLTRSPDKSTMIRLMNNNQSLIDMAQEYKKNDVVYHLKQRKKLYLYITGYEKFVHLLRAQRMVEAVKFFWTLPLEAKLFFAKQMYSRSITRWKEKP